MFKIEKAVIAANGEFNEITLAQAGLSDKEARLSSKKSGLTFHDADGSLFCYARFSTDVKKALIDKTLTLEQVAASCKISMSLYDNGDGNGEQKYYTLTKPDALRGGITLGKVKDLAKAAKPLTKVKATLADISAMLEI